MFPMVSPISECNKKTLDKIEKKDIKTVEVPEKVIIDLLKALKGIQRKLQKKLK